MTETFGLISGLIVALSAIPYGIRVYQRKIRPNMVGWSIWAFIGLALLLTYESSGAKANVWPAVFGFLSPSAIAILAIWRGERERPKWYEIMCAFFGLFSIGLWYFLRADKELAQYALYTAIVADIWAFIPTIIWVLRHPEHDRPLMWGMFGFGYGISIFAITDHTIANYSLPVYMFFSAMLVATILAKHRIRRGIPVRECI